MREAHLRTAITAWRQIALDTELNHVPFDQVLQIVQKVDDGPLDVDKPVMTTRAGMGGARRVPEHHARRFPPNKGWRSAHHGRQDGVGGPGSFSPSP